MKQPLFFLVLLLLAAGTQAQPNFDALQLTPQFPKANSTLEFKYNKRNSPLIDEKSVDIVVYVVAGNEFIVQEPALTRKGDIYSGSVWIDSNANCIAFGFSTDNIKDLNYNKGYIIPVYGANNQPVQGYYMAAANFASGAGEYFFGLPTDAKKAYAIATEGLSAYPQARANPEYLNFYLSAVSRSERAEAAPIVHKELANFESAGKLSEEGYDLLTNWYRGDKQVAKADSLLAAKKAAFPDGKWKKSEADMAIAREKDIHKKITLFNEYLQAYPATEKDKPVLDKYRSQIANAYAAINNLTAYAEWNNQLPPAAAAKNNNSIAWRMAEKDEHIEEAKKMAQQASTWAKAEISNPTQKKPASLTQKAWMEQRRNSAAMFGDTYAFILYKLGDYKTAYPIAKEAAEFKKLEDADYNERYAMLAVKTLPAAQSTALLENFVKSAAATSATKELLKKLYVEKHKGETGFDQYLATLEADAKIKKREALAKTMLNDAAPAWSLKDFEGKTVSSADMKGKIVIVDFWATWCGPCIASMPGMNKAVQKYKDDKNVKFLFVDTWENVDDKLANAKSFMTKKGFPFYVLMDTEDKMVTDFKVSGIPTKFVLDKTGKIRFKAVGFNGNDDELVDEISTMIELAGK